LPLDGQAFGPRVFGEKAAQPRGIVLSDQIFDGLQR
jgi:hypothetical protein